MIYKFNGIYINFNHTQKLWERCLYWSIKQKSTQITPNFRQKCRWWWLTRLREGWLSWSLGNLRKAVSLSLQRKALIHTQASSPMIPYSSSRPAHSLTSLKTLRTTNKNMEKIVRSSWPWTAYDPNPQSFLPIKILISFSLSTLYFIILLLLQITVAQIKSVIASKPTIIG